MEEKLETDMETSGITSIMENQVENDMEDEMETGQGKVSSTRIRDCDATAHITRVLYSVRQCVARAIIPEGPYEV